jgi:cation/acetate symporter
MHVVAAVGLASENATTVRVGIFAVVLAITLLITRWAAKRTKSAEEFYAAGRGITGTQNGIAIAGDYLSASTFLGYAGLMYLFGFDGWIIGLAAIMSFLPVLYLLAERMRNSGKFTVADVLSFRMRERPVRAATAINTLVISGIYLVAQLIGAGLLIQALAGISFGLAVIICGAFMIVYVAFGGMLATTWVQIVKAVMLMTAGVVVAIAVLGEFSFDPSALLDKAAAESEAGKDTLGPGLQFDQPIVLISTGLTIFLGTAGLPHILMRFFTVPDAKAARKSVVWTIALIGTFTLLVTVIGFGARAILGTGSEEAAGEGGNLAAPLLAQSLGGGDGTAGGDIALALFAAAAFATILAVVAGLVIAASGALAHDLWTNVLGRSDERREARIARIAAVGVGVVAILATLAIGSGFNVTLLVTFAFVISASASFPPLLLALYWRRFNTTGALVGIAFGLVSSVIMLALSPTIWPGPDSEGSPSPLTYPAIVTVPFAFLGCWLGTLIGGEPDNPHSYDELLVRGETALGAEEAEGAAARQAGPERERVKTGAGA